MPVYAYACKDCAHAFDIRQSFSEDALTVCPECGGGLRKKFNTVGVVFKGSGFYRNDSRSGASGSDASGSGAPASTTSETTSSSAEAPAPAAAGSSAASAPSGSASSSGGSSSGGSTS